MNTNSSFEQNHSTPRPPLNARFIQTVINLAFLVMIIGLLTSFFTKPADSDFSKDGLTTELSAQPYLGQLAIFPYSFAPVGWARCDGQILSISQNTALFSLIGTTFGGNGQTTFALPDLRGRVILHNGTGPGLSPYVLGQKSGNELTTLIQNNLPAHSHTASGTVSYPAKNGSGDETNPGGGYPSTATTDFYAETPNTTLGPASVNVTVNNTGSNVPFSNIQPYLAVGYYIALTGQFPSQN